MWVDAVEEAADEWTTNSPVTLDEDPLSTEIYFYLVPDLYSECPDALGCADPNVGFSNHLVDVDVYLNREKNFSNGTCGSTGGYYFKKNTAMHELGHAAGWLDHTDDSDAVMYEYYVHTCYLDQHDIDSMEAQYDGHS